MGQISLRVALRFLFQQDSFVSDPEAEFAPFRLSQCDGSGTPNTVTNTKKINSWSMKWNIHRCTTEEIHNRTRIGKYIPAANLAKPPVLGEFCWFYAERI